MAFQVVWTPRAVEGFANIITYFEIKWTSKEIKNFIIETERILELIKHQPEIFQKSQKQKSLHRGVIHGLTIFTYRINVKSNQIQLINFRATKRKQLR